MYSYRINIKYPLPSTLECAKKYIVNAEEVSISMQHYCLKIEAILFDCFIIRLILSSSNYVIIISRILLLS
jgi:hypothetical protein